MKRPTPQGLVVVAALLALVGLALMVWSVLVPHPIPVVAAMTLGQAIGTFSVLLYLAAIWSDLRRPSA